MSQLYNAFIRGIDGKTGKSKIIASAFITNKTKLPQTCVLVYGKRQISAELVKAEELIQMASPTKPLQVFLNGIPTSVPEEPSQKLLRISVKTFNDEMLGIKVPPTMKVSEVKGLLEREHKILSEDLRIIFAGKQLEDENSLADYNVRDDSTFHLFRRLRGSGNNFVSVDLASSKMNGKGVEDGPRWLSFSQGLNLIGTCPNQKCISYKPGNGMVISRVGNGLRIFTPEDNLVSCPACNEGEFTPSNFLVNKARSLFRFKKVGEGEEVKQRLLECVEDSCFEYATFIPKESGGASYDLIEIRTVERNSSPFTCVDCAEEIGGRAEEKVLEGCGHAYHSFCYSGSSSCSSVCDVGVAFWSEEEMDREWEIQQLLRADRWQRKFIQENLTALTKDTICNTALFNHLLKENVISSSDKNTLEIIQDKDEKVSKLYDLIPSRRNGFVVLIEALQEIKQTGAALLLLDGLRRNDRPAWEKIQGK